MPHLDLKVRRDPRPLTQTDLRAWGAVFCAELNQLRQAVGLPLLTPQTLDAAVQAARHPARPEEGP